MTNLSLSIDLAIRYKGTIAEASSKDCKRSRIRTLGHNQYNAAIKNKIGSKWSPNRFPPWLYFIVQNKEFPWVTLQVAWSKIPKSQPPEHKLKCRTILIIEKNKKVRPPKRITRSLSFKALSRKKKLTIIEFLKFFLSKSHLDKNKKTNPVVGAKILLIDIFGLINE